jgi:hypothetical protein
VSRAVPPEVFAERDRFIQSTNDDCAIRLTEFLTHSDDVAYFIGSGLSRPDYPPWQELVTRMREYFEQHHGSCPAGIPTDADVERLSPQELPAVFQLFRAHHSNSYVDCIKALFYDHQPTRHHDSTTRILKKGPSLIATLNFDPAIEAAAMACDVTVTPRFFPTIGFIAQEHDDNPVVMHVHGMFHPELYGDPDLIALHSSGYQRFYGSGAIFNLFGEIFFGRDVVFLGTALSEPEMVGFFERLQGYFAKSGKSRNRKILALLHSASDDISPSIDVVERMRDILREERSSDTTYESNMGISRVRFLKKDQLFTGLSDVLRTAFGDNIPPPPQSPW